LNDTIKPNRGQYRAQFTTEFDWADPLTNRAALDEAVDKLRKMADALEEFQRDDILTVYGPGCYGIQGWWSDNEKNGNGLQNSNGD
jgi:hypothetical protein